MPNHTNITAPILVIGPGRSGTSWLLHALDEHPDIRDVIENNIVDSMYDALLGRSWTREWKWLGDPHEVRSRVINATREALCALLPTAEPRWVMKAIWPERNLAWHREVFPDATWLHISRSPTTTIPSMQESLGPAFADFDHCQAQYATSHRRALEIKRERLPYMRVRQEDAAADPAAVWAQLCERCKLPPAPLGRLDAEINASPSTKGVVRQGREPLPWSQLYHEVHETARALGYEPDAPPRPGSLAKRIDQIEGNASVAAFMDFEQRLAAAQTLGGRTLLQLTFSKLAGRFRTGRDSPK